MLTDYTGYIVPYIAIGLVLSIVVYAFEGALNGGQIGRGRWWLFQLIWQDVRWFSLGGLKRRTEYIRGKVGPDSSHQGFIDGYSYEEIRNQNLYQEVAKKTLGSGWIFWGFNVFFMIFFWWVGVLILLILIIR
jgi:hypothetical protein